MRLLKIIFFAAAGLLPKGGIAEVLSIGMMQNLSASSVIVHPDIGGYILFADGNKLMDLNSGNLLQFTLEDGRVRVRSFDRDMGLFSKLMLLAESSDNSFRIKSIVPQSDVKVYDDHLEVTAAGGRLRLVNKVDLEDYVGGVIEAEVGWKANPEFLKVQAILARTYALSHARRHEADGFELCDQVHCQVYHHKSMKYPVLKAVDDSRGMILIDNELRLITAAFHSNCGGQTQNSEDVWLTHKPYLRSVTDTFCRTQHNASWVKEVSRDQWAGYLKRKNGSTSLPDSVFARYAFRFPQEERQVVYAGLGIPLKGIRSDWDLRSTYFSVEEEGGRVLLRGKGYGHGVGLCQEGAMHMADVGMNFKEILFHYFTGINIVSIEALRFFLED